MAEALFLRAGLGFVFLSILVLSRQGLPIDLFIVSKDEQLTDSLNAQVTDQSH